MTTLQYKNDISKKLKKLGLDLPEFEYVVKCLARALSDYENAVKTFDESGGKMIVEFTNKAGATNTAKNPLYVAIEALRQDVLAYSRELGLTPASLKRLDESKLKGKKETGLAAVLRLVDKSG